MTRVLFTMSVLVAAAAAACAGASGSDDLFGGAGSGTGVGSPAPGPSTATSTDPTDPSDPASPAGPAPTTPGAPGDPGNPGDPQDPGDPGPKTDCAISYKNDILPHLGTWGCSGVTCHGGPVALNQPAINAQDAAGTYKALTTYAIANKPYADTKSTKVGDSSMDCNLRGTCGTKMPIGRALTPADLKLVDQWLSCGSPDN